MCYVIHQLQCMMSKLIEQKIYYLSFNYGKFPRYHDSSIFMQKSFYYIFWRAVLAWACPKYPRFQIQKSIFCEIPTMLSIVCFFNTQLIYSCFTSLLASSFSCFDCLGEILVSLVDYSEKFQFSFRFKHGGQVYRRTTCLVLCLSLVDYSEKFQVSFRFKPCGLFLKNLVQFQVYALWTILKSFSLVYV